MKNFKLFTALTFLSPLFIFSRAEAIKDNSTKSTEEKIPTQFAFVILEEVWSKSFRYAKIKAHMEAEAKKLEDLKPELQAKYQAIMSDTKTTNEEKQIKLQSLEKELRDKVSKLQSLESRLNVLITKYTSEFLKREKHKYQKVEIINSGNLYVYNDNYLKVSCVNLTQIFLSGLEEELKKFGIR